MRAKRSLLGKCLTFVRQRTDCCAIVVVHRYNGAIFVVQTILWSGMGVVYGVNLVKSGVYLTIP